MTNDALELVELVNAFHHFKTTHDGGLQAFCAHFLANNTPSTPAPYAEFQSSSQVQEPAVALPLHQHLGYLFGRMSRFARAESTRRLPQVGLQSFEDVLMLTHIGRLGDPSKKQVIEESMVEYSTGIEVLKRLKLTEHILEFENPLDRRSKKITLTAKGQQAAADSHQVLEQLSQHMFCSLTPQDQSLLSIILQKLDAHHTELRNKEK